LLTLLSRETPFPNEEGELPNGEFEPIESQTSHAFSTILQQKTILSEAKVLVIGAGGLGCELLKDLAMSAISNVHVIDLDTIDVTNLNRQFLFRLKDVGKPKATVAAEFINKRCPWMNVTPHFGKIQDFDAEFYQSFRCIISGLDNVEARRWMNSLLCGLVQYDDDGDIDPDSVIPMIDGGTEGFKGQARVILPKFTSCFECTLDMFPPQETFPLCTIAETPRKPEHCIAYAFIILWDKNFPNQKLDKDSPTDMKWVFNQAQKRAQQFGIPGVTYNLTMGVVKNIIPAVASTNAIVAAACVNECVKILTFCSQTLNTYWMYMGSSGIYSHTFVPEQKDDCLVCAAPVMSQTLSKSTTLEKLFEKLKDELRLLHPSATTDSNQTLYMTRPKALEKVTRVNLKKSLGELIVDGQKLTITDEALANMALSLTVNLE